ncbi:hypothetical protein [Natrinema gari]|uniref:Uncharacterized protein n=1 Tax=Natrinema gari JCM 14663 TaxID=1230459 RepID=L9ZFJ1_9EURY|nr:hypothetical protein [Natrinema gari]ELY83953.1 hypothetical protein C486_01959 [Natrinema gari JCM 14663]
MSVIRQPEVLGRTTRRRVVGVAAALSAAAVETAGVGLWFGLVVGSRTIAAALAGLGVLFCGALLRTGVFGATVTDLETLVEPARLGAALVLTAGWIVWLFVAELIGGSVGVAVGTAVLAGILTGQFALERRVFRPRAADGATVVPGLVLAAGASVLLATAWFLDRGLSAPPLSLGFTTIVVELTALHIGLLAFALSGALAHQRRLQRALDP